MSALVRSAILRKLRPPYAQAMRVVYAFCATAPTNLGLTLEIPAGAVLVSPGDGVVDLIAPLGAKWRNDLGTSRMTAVRIDHGAGVKTWLHGLDQVSVGFGPVTRGQRVGVSALGQVFFAAEQHGQLIDPTFLNANFGLQDGFINVANQTKVRHAPDLLTTAVSDIASALYSGIRYFLPPVLPVRLNVDFNGNGTKSGPAAIGEAGDVWHSVSPLDFFATPTTYQACVGVTFQAAQGFFLTDWRGAATKVYLERIELTASAGSSAFFDPMLSRWVGGYTGITPKLNSFSIRNLPKGTYRVYVYSNGGTTSDPTSAYVSVDGGAPTLATLTPVGTAAWVETRNYVKFTSLAVVQGKITFSLYGYLAGVQVERTAT